MRVRVKRCGCEILGPAITGDGDTAHIVTVKRFTHPWLPSKTVVATVDDLWQGRDIPVANPYMIVLDTPLWPWPGELVPAVLNRLGGMLSLDPSRLALRVTDGHCAFHGTEDVQHPVLLSRR